MIIDVFPFFNELDLLEIRLNELKGVVDWFVLSEATLTFSNRPKPMVFAENRDRFEHYPILYVPVDIYYGVNKQDAWAMDHYQKQVGLTEALIRLQPTKDDILIVSDCDEIPMAHAVRRFQETDWPIATLDMGMYYYYMNLRCVNKQWHPAKILRAIPPVLSQEDIRYHTKRAPLISPGGWHFSYLGGTEKIQYKLASFAHREKDIEQWNKINEIEMRVNSGKDLFDRRYNYVTVPNLDFLPKYVLEHMDRFGQYIREDWK